MQKFYDEEDVRAAAEALRGKTGGSELYTLAQIAPAIASMEGGAGVPSYWEDALRQRLSVIRSRRGYQFAYLTDLHWENNEKRSPAILRRIMMLSGVNNAVCGGDLIVQQPTKDKALTLLKQVRGAFSGTQMAYCMGNHDLNSEESGDTTVFLTEAEWRAVFSTEHTGVSYYSHPGTGDTTAFGYRDHPESKIREIFVNTGGMKHTTSNNAHWAAAMIWACDRIKELSADWGVLIFAHIWWAPTGHMVKQSIATTIENYLTQYASHRQAEIIAVITGHTHDDYYDYNATEGYLITSTSTDAGEAQTTISEADKTRTPGTTLEQCFDVITVDRQNKTLYFDRIGAGSSRALPYYYMPTLSITYNLSAVTSSNSAASVQTGTAYSSTLTPESGKEMSSVVITMGGTDITSTAYDASTGAVSIASVTGPVVITASASAARPVWTNLVPTSLSTTGAVYNGTGYKDGKYLSNTTATFEGGNDAIFTLTGRIPYSTADFNDGKILVFSGLNWTTDDHCRMAFCNSLTSATSSPYCKGSATASGNTGNIRTYFTLTEYADYWTLTPIAGATSAQFSYLACSLKGSGVSLSVGIV